MLLCHSHIELRLSWDWSWGWFEFEVEVRLNWGWGWDEVKLKFSWSWVWSFQTCTGMKLKKMNLICSFIYVTIWTCHHLKIIIYFISFHICHHLNMSPSEKFSNLSPSWYENRRFRFSYRAFRWWQMSPSESLVWKFFIPVTKKCFQMVTVW